MTQCVDRVWNFFLATKTDQVDQGVLLLLASDGLGRPLAALILSDVPPKRDEDHWEKKEEEEEEVNNATEKDALEKREAQRKENDKEVSKEDKTQDGIKEMLELTTGLEVQNSFLSNKVSGVFFLRCHRSPLFTLAFTFAWEGGEVLIPNQARKKLKAPYQESTEGNPMLSGKPSCLSC